MLRLAAQRTKDSLRQSLERRYGPTGVGFIESFGSCIALGLLLGISLPQLGIALVSAEIYSSLAQIAATLLVAYSIEMAAVVRDYGRGGNRDAQSEWDRDNNVGLLVGFGTCGLVGVLTAMVCGQHGTTSTFLELLGGIALGGTLMIGALIVVLPLFWRERTKRVAPEPAS